MSPTCFCSTLHESPGTEAGGSGGDDDDDDSESSNSIDRTSHAKKRGKSKEETRSSRSARSDKKVKKEKEIRKEKTRTNGSPSSQARLGKENDILEGGGPFRRHAETAVAGYMFNPTLSRRTRWAQLHIFACNQCLELERLIKVCCLLLSALLKHPGRRKSNLRHLFVRFPACLCYGISKRPC